MTKSDVRKSTIDRIPKTKKRKSRVPKDQPQIVSSVEDDTLLEVEDGWGLFKENGWIPLDKDNNPTRAGRNILWCQKYIHIPEGKFVGQKLKMAHFMKEDFAAIYDNPNGTRRAIISRGRKNAKSAEAAFIMLVHLCGQESKFNGQLYSAAQSRDQASLIFSLAAKMIRMNRDLSMAVTIKDTVKELYCAERGTRYRALSAETSTAFGLSPVLIIHDELGQVRGPRSTLYEALETATAAQEDPLSIVISTQAPGDNDLLSILIDDAKAGHDPHTVLRFHTSDPEDDPFDVETIKKANPAFDIFMNKTEVLDMAMNAKRMPSRQAEFENLVLNRRVEANNPFISATVWKACGGEVGDLHGIPLYAGLDLSSVNDLTALVLVGKIEGVWHVKPTFWLPEVGLVEKSKQDRVPYDLWAQQGFLQTTAGKTISYEYVAAELFKVFQEYNIRKLAFDRWGMRYLKPWLIEAGFTEQLIEEKFQEVGQGTMSMTPSLRSLEQAILEGQLCHGGHPVLTMCAANSVIEGTDAARKLSKRKSTGRIDGMVALADAFIVIPDAPLIDVSALIA